MTGFLQECYRFIRDFTPSLEHELRDLDDFLLLLV